jgi:hypothetical protein
LKHGSAQPQLNSASAAKAEFKKLRFDRAEARPSETRRDSLTGAARISCEFMLHAAVFSGEASIQAYLCFLHKPFACLECRAAM